MFLERLLIQAQFLTLKANLCNGLKKTGGYSRLADNNRVVIIQPNGETFSNTNEFFTLFQEKEYLMPGATIYVPKFIGKVDGIDSRQLYHQL